MILLPGFAGPLEQWQFELRKLSRSALQDLAETLTFTRMDPPEHLLKLVRDSKRHGRWMDVHRRSERFRADPDAAIEESLRRRLAATKAARRRKRASK